MKIQDLKDNLDEDTFINILFHNDITKTRYFIILKEYIQNQSKYEGIRDFLLEQISIFKSTIRLFLFSNFTIKYNNQTTLLYHIISLYY